MGNEEKRLFCNNREKRILKVENKKLERQSIHLKKESDTILKKRKIILAMGQDLINTEVKF